MWGQHTELKAKPGKRDELIRRFLEAADIQRDNPDCLLLVTSESLGDDDAVLVTEMYTSKDAWESARNRPEISEWSSDMPALVESKVRQSELTPVGGKGLERITA